MKAMKVPEEEKKGPVSVEMAKKMSQSVALTHTESLTNIQRLESDDITMIIQKA